MRWQLFGGGCRVENRRLASTKNPSAVSSMQCKVMVDPFIITTNKQHCPFKQIEKAINTVPKLTITQTLNDLLVVYHLRLPCKTSTISNVFLLELVQDTEYGRLQIGPTTSEMSSINSTLQFYMKLRLLPLQL
jgi:hypothetical protein